MQARELAGLLQEGDLRVTDEKRLADAEVDVHKVARGG